MPEIRLLKLDLSLIFFFGNLGKTLNPRLQSSSQIVVDIVTFYLGFGVFKNCKIYIKPIYFGFS